MIQFNFYLTKSVHEINFKKSYLEFMGYIVIVMIVGQWICKETQVWVKTLVWDWFNGHDCLAAYHVRGLDLYCAIYVCHNAVNIYNVGHRFVSLIPSCSCKLNFPASCT